MIIQSWIVGFPMLPLVRIVAQLCLGLSEFFFVLTKNSVSLFRVFPKCFSGFGYHLSVMERFFFSFTTVVLFGNCHIVSGVGQMVSGNCNI